MVLNANLLIAIDHQAKRNDRDYFEFIGGLLITRIFAKIVIFFNFSIFQLILNHRVNIQR